MTNSQPKLRTLVFITSLLTLFGTPVAHSQAIDSPDEPEFVPGELIIKFRSSAANAQLGDALQRGDLSLRRVIAMRQKDHPGLNVAQTRLGVAAAIQLLRNHPAVEYVQPNWVYRHQVVPNDPVYTVGQHWGMYGDATVPANPFGSQAGEAWANGATGSSDVCVAIIDTGVQVDHLELAPNIWVNPGEIPNNGVDDDGNGFVDDVHGWDFFHNDARVFDDPSADYHGTHVAGTIGALGNNAYGVVGVSWNVRMIPVKFLGPDGGTTADAVEAVNYVVALKERGVNIVAMNNSWGGGGYDPSLLAAITAAANRGILFVAAAGNGNSRGNAINTDWFKYYPAAYNTTAGAGYDSVISVTALDSSGNKASWANYGKSSVDLGAPGVDIRSTYPGYFANLDGTSMAVPHVTGGIALYAATYPEMSAPQIRQAILQAAVDTPTPSMAGRTVTGGRLNLGGNLLVPPVPPEPQPPVALAGPDQVASDVDGDGYASMTLDGRGSNDPDGVIVSHVWTAGDQEFGYVPRVTAEFSVGTHTVTLTVTDDTGLTDSDEAVITVLANQPPVANAGLDQTVSDTDGNGSQAVSLNGSGSFDPDGNIVSYLWDEGGTFLGNTVTINPALQVGVHNITLIVTDQAGASHSDTIRVTVEPAPAEVLVFTDSFEIGEWNGLWTEDSQNDWFRSTQRATAGARSAEVDGAASNAALTSIAINLQGRTNARISFDWYIESGLDSGEYLEFRVSANGGSSWTQQAILRGNVDAENTWQSRTVELNGITQLRLQFRGQMSDSTEDANLDNVRVLAY